MSDVTSQALSCMAEMHFAGKVVHLENGGDPLMLVPPNWGTKNMAEFLPPKRIKQTMRFSESGSFADYVNRFKTDNTMVFVRLNLDDDSTPRGATFVAALDYHSPAPELKPSHCHHSARFDAVETPEWIAWMRADREAMNQVDFATWLEDNQKVFVEPKGAELLEVVRSLHGHRNARFNTALRLDNGAYSASYEEDVTVRGNNATANGSIELPKEVKAGIAPFEGCQAYEVTARLKSRVSDRRLSLFFETVQPHVIVRDAIKGLMEEIATKTGIVPLIGWY